MNTVQLPNRLADSPIPKDFHYENDYSTHTTFPFNAALINTVEALKILALGDFEGQTGSIRVRIEDYATPLIIISSPAGPTVKRKYAIWGLVLALSHLAVSSQCHESHFTFTWKGEKVAEIMYEVPGPRLDTATAKRDTDESITQVYNREIDASLLIKRANSSPASTLTVPSNDTSVAAGPRIRVTMSYVGAKPIVQLDMVLAILFVLCQAAVFPKDTLLPSQWAPSVQNPDCAFDAQSFSLPQLLDYGFLIDVVADSATFLVEHGSWRGIEMVAKVEGIEIGRMTLGQ
ncbi:MAG: hypothetical protein LQ350_008214 [Teloschistes chrysophthalmus]|nr:MAG: hypothetical protein LQ350_008214 [Niorma chrysophthalma]